MMDDAQVEDSNVIIDAILRRRSVPTVREDRPLREDITAILDAAVAAPNHHRTNPWRFVVLTGEARNELGSVMAASLGESLDDPALPDSQAALQRERGKPLRAPVLIAVATIPSDDPRVMEIEEIAATAAAVENMLLACEALGLAAMWRTGAPARDPNVKAFLGLPENAQIIAFVYVGYADINVPPRRNRDSEPYTRWIGWDE